MARRVAFLPSCRSGSARGDATAPTSPNMCYNFLQELILQGGDPSQPGEG
jgi:hypothetical protein